MGRFLYARGNGNTAFYSFFEVLLGVVGCAVVLGVFVRSSVPFSSSKANSSSGSVRLKPQARFDFAVRFALEKGERPALRSSVGLLMDSTDNG
jgi:hypothetical protein